MTRIFLVFQLILLFVPLQIFAQNDESSVAAQIFKKTSPSVVLIEVYNEEGKIFKKGTGFLVSADGKILTNYHVVSNTKRATVRLTNGDAYDTVDVIDIDKRKDIALIKIRASDLPFLTLGKSSTIEVGEKIFSVSNPLGVFRNSLSEGLISAIRLGDGYRFLQISAPISSGSSGGPLLNSKGEVIGIVFGSVEEGQSLNFAIPIDYAKGMLPLSQTKSLASIYEPIENPDTETNDGKPNLTSVPKTIDYDSVSEDIKKEGIAPYFQRRIGSLTPEDIEKLLGKSLQTYNYQDNVAFVFFDPTKVFKKIVFFFDNSSRKLKSFIGTPDSYLTLESMKGIFGTDDKKLRTKDQNGNKFFFYPNLNRMIMTDKNEVVISILYK